MERVLGQITQIRFFSSLLFQIKKSSCSPQNGISESHTFPNHICAFESRLVRGGGRGVTGMPWISGSLQES